MNPEPYFITDPRNGQIRLRQNHARGRQIITIPNERATGGWLKKKNLPKDVYQQLRLQNIIARLRKTERILEAKGLHNEPLAVIWEEQFKPVEADAPSGNLIIDWCAWRASLSGYHYKRGYLNIIAHLKDWKRPTALFVDINEKWVIDYCKYLSEARGLKTSSINKTMAYLRSVMKSAATNNQPVGSIPERLKRSVVGGKKSTIKIPLDFGEVQRLIDLNRLPRHLEVIRDMFVLMCFTGVRVGDLLNPEWVITNDRIYNQQSKTDQIHCITLNRFALAIIKKYATVSLDGSLKISLPDHEGQYLNRQYKKLAAMAHIKKNITNHIARHSFARMLSDMGLSEQLRAAELGHKANRSVTASYGNIDTDLQIKMVAKKWEKSISLWKGDYLEWYEAVNS